MSNEEFMMSIYNKLKELFSNAVIVNCLMYEDIIKAQVSIHPNFYKEFEISYKDAMCYTKKHMCNSIIEEECFKDYINFKCEEIVDSYKKFVCQRMTDKLFMEV